MYYTPRAVCLCSIAGAFLTLRVVCEQAAARVAAKQQGLAIAAPGQSHTQPMGDDGWKDTMVKNNAAAQVTPLPIMMACCPSCRERLGAVLMLLRHERVC